MEPPLRLPARAGGETGLAGSALPVWGVEGVRESDMRVDLVEFNAAARCKRFALLSIKYAQRHRPRHGKQQQSRGDGVEAVSVVASPVGWRGVA